MIDQSIKFLQDNWLTILLVIGALIVVLKAVADLRLRWAKITPEKDDDEKAKIFKAKVMVFIQFLKDIFKVGKNDKSKE